MPVTEPLLDWYEAQHRALPWRSTRDPYAILVSEVMLQQTQAARVVPYYDRWLERFPTPAALAAAPVRDVLTEWSGLGYNRRALAVQAAARMVVERGWPEPLTELPGVGPYTAAAVASFAWGAQVAAVDTNVRRVIERHDGARRPPRDLAQRAAELLPEGRAAAWNQAMMELGATICRPRRPACEACPVRGGCAAAKRAAVAAPAAATPGKATPGKATPGKATPGKATPGNATPGKTTPAMASRRTREPFEDTDRFARGRLLAALVHATEAPPLDRERRERALAGLERDGLIVRGQDGEPRLP
jgi:A/G-specific adenine glycosylase